MAEAVPGTPEVPVPQADGSPLEFGEPDGQWHMDFQGLLHLGYLTASFEWCGHKIVIKTLNGREDLLIASLIRDWDATIGATKAYAIAVAGLSVLWIDGQPMPTPLGEDESNPDRWAAERFAYAQRWFEPTINAIFNAHLKLLARVSEVVTEMGKEPAPAGWSDSSGSLAPGDFSPAAPSL